MPAFTLVPDKVSFAEEEDKTLAYWTKIKAFETSVERSVGKKEYTFYDGPPFATGLPHYGHILAGTIKDVVTRYAHQTGHHVTRRFGWDCHGLPVEYEIDKKLGIKTKEDVAAMGIDRYNAECRAIVMRYSNEWETIVKRMGRWIDFDNDYKTLDTNFMESVWWVFKELFNKGLVYQGFKVMPYSTACTTPLSNFESGQNYKDVLDPAVVVTFPVLPNKDFSLLAWTTTPWTLPSNLGLCVNEAMDYVKVLDKASKNVYVLAKARLHFLYPPKKGTKKQPAPKKEAPKKDEKKESRFKAKVVVGVAPIAPSDESKYDILEEMKGSALKGLRYEPLFPYFKHLADSDGTFVVMTDDYVAEDGGTGIVHQAPAFGEDDYRVCLAHGIIKRGAGITCPVDDNGHFTEEVVDFKGRHVKEADRDIIRHLKAAGRLIMDQQINHPYPHCWRSDTPLIYKAVPSWFVNVPSIKEKLLANNLRSSWVPKVVQEKRFANWLSDACDWSVSRNRYWGTPLPIWSSEDGEELVCVGSVAELEELSGVKGITDLHRDNIDHITIPSKKGKGLLKRVEEVFDCWFESGSMPYAQLHYPFENKEKFEAGFPADFIAEGLDQTRGWFYTLMVISTALFDKPPFKNLIVNGLVLASDGKKMSKRLKNYPDPMLVVSEYGADALRLYLINSPVVRAEPLAFQEQGVREVAQKIFLPWYNVYRFFIAEARRLELETGVPLANVADIHTQTDNKMDKWILSSLQTLIASVREEMSKYHLYTVIPHLLFFIDQLSRWYVRFNKGRLKGSGKACRDSLCTLYRVLYELCRLMGPFTPFLVENMYQNLKHGMPLALREDSVHFLMVPEADTSMVDQDIERQVTHMQTVIELGRAAREAAKISLRVPVTRVKIVHPDAQTLADLEAMRGYVMDELNCRELVLSSKVDEFVQLRVTPDRRALGRRFIKKANEAFKFLAGLKHADVEALQASGKASMTFADGEKADITIAEVLISSEFVGDKTLLEAQSNKEGMMLVLEKTLSDDCVQEGLAREVMSRVQQLRKKAGLSSEQRVAGWYEAKDASVLDMMVKKAPYITAGIRVVVAPMAGLKAEEKELAREECEVNGKPILIVLTAAAAPGANKAAPKKNSKKSRNSKKGKKSRK